MQQIDQKNLTLRDCLTKCSSQISKLNKTSFGNVQKHIKHLLQNLEVVRQETRMKYMMGTEAEITSAIEEWRFREELLSRRQASSDWLREGDSSTNFFHMKANSRRKVNQIHKLKDD